MNEIVQHKPMVMSPMTASEIQEQVNVIQKVMQQVMKEGTHFGKIPGCGDNKTLMKPGAEKILTTFRLAADPDVEDLSDRDKMRYRVKVRITSPSGIFLGAGVGECSSNEDKYKWRACYILEEYNATPEDRRRIKYSKYQNQPTKEQKQIRTNPDDIANTVLKMAKKRGLVDAVLTVTAASDIFTQDIEDIPEEIRSEIICNTGQKQEPAARPDYPEDRFHKNFPSWEKLIKSGKKSAADIIMTASSAFMLSAEQIKKINNTAKGEQQ